jgi:hypothetical protein
VLSVLSEWLPASLAVFRSSGALVRSFREILLVGGTAHIIHPRFPRSPEWPHLLGELKASSGAANATRPPPAGASTTRWSRRSLAFRWRKTLENGTCATIAEIAATEKINESYVARVLRLTLLAPEIVEAILNGKQLPQVRLPALIRPFPAAWCNQLKQITVQAKSES